MNLRKAVAYLLVTGMLIIPCVNVMADNIGVDDIISELDNLSDKDLEKVDIHLHTLLGKTGTDSDSDDRKISDDSYRDEIFSQFEKYGIDVYDESEFEMFEGTDIPVPESVLTGFPEGKAENKDDTKEYVYQFEDADEVKAYAKAYTLVLMGTDHKIEQKGDLMVVDDFVAAFGLATDGDYYDFIMYLS